MHATKMFVVKEILIFDIFKGGRYVDVTIWKYKSQQPETRKNFLVSGCCAACSFEQIIYRYRSSPAER